MEVLQELVAACLSVVYKTEDRTEETSLVFTVPTCSWGTLWFNFSDILTGSVCASVDLGML